MSELFIFMNTNAIKEGKLDDFKERFPSGSSCSRRTIPAFSTSASTLTRAARRRPSRSTRRRLDGLQMQVISGRHEQWYQFIDWSKLRIQDLGTPSDILVRRMGQAAGPDVRSASTRR